MLQNREAVLVTYLFASDALIEQKFQGREQHSVG